MIESLSEHVPNKIRHVSGKVFYSGRSAFSLPRPLYVLGINPGGDPRTHSEETIASHTRAVLAGPANWSAYRDESWRGYVPGAAQLQRRVLHVLNGVGLDPGMVPSSNLVFVRSKRLEDIAADFSGWANDCWTFHAAVLEALHPRAILCFGGKVGKYVRVKVGALDLLAESREKNNRGWRTRVFTSPAGIKVVVAPHPSIADWTASATDPTKLVQQALQ